MQMIAHNNLNLGDRLCSISAQRDVAAVADRRIAEFTGVSHPHEEISTDISKIAFAGEKKEKEK